MTSHFLLLCLLSVSFAVPQPPRWPNQWMTSWKMMWTESLAALPPFAKTNGIPPPPFRLATGKTYYDWSSSSILEVYEQVCIPIFPQGSDWKCHFLNYNEVAYLIMFEDRPKSYPPCCIFGKPWSAPSPDFIAKANIPYNGTSPILNRQVNWWVVDISRDQGGPFGYGFYNGTSTPAAFYFAGVTGYIEQYFEHFTDQKPPAGTFDLPAECQNATPCTMM
eukprot:TRINITY_DN889_c0_g1_i1.p1 TRINITY_DN889_c0_g1~~TRINITY_DN889_c0_g1_i1.p1  ORF type:complete len:220 (+),score=32.28 TRINITY_DN889_c0_g1_i1:44-703(+)